MRCGVNFTEKDGRRGSALFVTDRLRASVERLASVLEREGLMLSKIAAVRDETRKERDGAPGGQPFPMDDGILLRAAERSLFIGIECVADVGNLLIDALLMRDPASYADIVEILADEQVIRPELDSRIRKMVEYRGVLVREYLADDQTGRVWELAADSAAFGEFAAAARAYVRAH